jgi:hypothetical protein
MFTETECWNGTFAGHPDRGLLVNTEVDTGGDRGQERLERLRSGWE